MTTQLTFYLSRLTGRKFRTPDLKPIGIIKDFLIDHTLERPKIIGLKVKIDKKYKFVDFSEFEIRKEKYKYSSNLQESLRI